MDILEKRTYDARLFDVNLTDLLDDYETVSAVSTVIADQGSLTFGTGTVNSSVVTYPDGTTAAIGKAIQFEISGGRIPPGVAELMCTVRPRITTSLGNELEATVLLRLTDRVG